MKDKVRHEIKLSTMLTVSVFLLVLIVELLLIGNSNFVSHTIFSERVEHDLAIVTELNSEYAEIFLEEQREKVNIFSNTPIIVDFVEVTPGGSERDALVDELDRMRMAGKHFEAIFIIDLDNVVIASTHPGFVGSVYDPPKGNDAEVSYVYYSDILSENIIGFSAKIFSEGNKHIGTFVAITKLSDLADIVSRNGLGESGEVFVIDSEGFLITPSKFLKGENKGVLTQQVGAEDTRKCLTSKQGASEVKVHRDYLDYRGKEVFAAHTGIAGTEWCVIAKIDSAEISQLSRSVFLKNLIAIPVIVLIAVTFLAFSLGRFLDRTYRRMEGET